MAKEESRRLAEYKSHGGRKLVEKSILALAVLVAAVATARAETYAEMAQFAQSICGDIPEGSLTRTAIQGKVQANAGVLAKILSGSADVSGSRSDEIYKGIPFDKLPDRIPTIAMCKSELVKLLLSQKQRAEEGFESMIARYQMEFQQRANRVRFSNNPRPQCIEYQRRIDTAVTNFISFSTDNSFYREKSTDEKKDALQQNYRAVNQILDGLTAQARSSQCLLQG